LSSGQRLLLMCYEQVTLLQRAPAQRTRLQSERLNSDSRTAALGTVSW
jgi:hypothetical protein